ncbi:hypothetical protein GQ600_23889 [Phytophthora cactorum]|nr:hypothetical protein GQ600_23889 [Phytophthora cactorum]
MELYDAHGYVHRHNNGKSGNADTYKCAQHHKCDRFFRIRKLRATEPRTLPFLLEVKGSHSGKLKGHKKKGIHPAFAVEVDAAAMGKDGPQAILNSLQMKYENQAHLLRHLPTRTMTKSHRGYLMGKAAEATKIETFTDLYQWASLRMCQDEASLLGVQNEMLVLKCFEHRFEEAGASKKSFGPIMTTRRVFRNVQTAPWNEPGEEEETS